MKLTTEELKTELKALINSAEAYMKYHEEKFYSGMNVKLTGLWPAIERAKRALNND